MTATMTMDTTKANLFAPPPPAPAVPAPVALLQPKPFNGKVDAQKLYEKNEDVIAELNIRRELEALGVLVGENPSEYGWVACSPLLCADRPTSPGIHAQVNLKSGIYSERSEAPGSGTPTVLTLFDLSSYYRHIPIEEVVVEFRERHERVQQAKREQAEKLAQEEAAAKAVLAPPPAPEPDPPAPQPVAQEAPPAAEADDTPPFAVPEPAETGPAPEAPPVPVVETAPAPAGADVHEDYARRRAEEGRLTAEFRERRAIRFKLDGELHRIEAEIRDLQETRAKLMAEWNIAAMNMQQAGENLLSFVANDQPPAVPCPAEESAGAAEAPAATVDPPAVADGDDSSEVPISALGSLPESLRERLVSHGIPTVTELLKRYREGSLRGIPRIGDAAFAKIETALAPYLG